MLPDSFLDWWFAPWGYAKDAPPYSALVADYMGQRDSYHLWCAQADVAANFPERFDPEWHATVTDDGSELVEAARLFAGLIAARRHDQTVLKQLQFDDRRWCLGIATTQPLDGCELPFAEDDPVEVRGLVELARRLEYGFPGIWSRLRLTLPAALAGRVGQLLGAALETGERAAASRRAQRCWSLCRARAARAALQFQGTE
ncbi:MAG: hypothetical protein JWM42_2624 [Burkholderia sp.]|nr:hypothetical protein [Burkholderia sp.]